MTRPVLAGDSPHPGGNGSERKAKGPYFEFAKKKWETEDTFRFVLLRTRASGCNAPVCTHSAPHHKSITISTYCMLPDGSFWPEVQEGMHQVDHGVVICKLCQRHHKANNFAGEGYRYMVFNTSYKPRL